MLLIQFIFFAWSKNNIIAFFQYIYNLPIKVKHALILRWMTCPLPRNALMQWHTLRLLIVMPIIDVQGQGTMLLEDVL